ncbi:single-stranded DNA-binding protein [Rhodococcus qingshengii]|uniref:single-stranded DNA-binding protein n=1 Tax=Rhodococcus TaxID=1827 RepID=UPI001E6425EE|nr:MULTISPECIES: single-stranded DNA-binding protein [Rhodococcus]MCD2099615.1 single-stranded DNA-binding protein [Rhodococcus rhodochrous]MCD2123983.1 single-stranded DNA-binding protein [Rhodococcus rhodochrous]MCQ4136585.1 single-stranded DNA-binding protein [Rhodococcus rhodochrous]MDJ0490629.1 single-stranded DNA-binding protein [Rhodococcus qingshengii]
MAGEAPFTIVGNLVAEPEMRFTPNGAAVANFTVAQTPRRFDKNTNQFVDGEPLFMRCNVWREQAQNLAESNLTKGQRVVVTGVLKQRSWETPQGEKRTTIELEVEDIGASFKYATAAVTRKAPNGGNGGSQGGFGGGQQTQPDPWATSAPAVNAPAGSGSFDSAPF